MGWFFELLASQNSKKIKTPFISVYVITFALLHTKLLFLLLPFASELPPEERLHRIEQSIAKIWENWDLAFCVLWTVLIITGYNLISVVQKWITLFFENKMYPSVIEHLGATIHTDEEMEKARKARAIADEALKQKEERITYLVEQTNKLEEQVKGLQQSERAAAANLKKLEDLSEKEKLDLKTSARKLYGNMIRDRIRVYVETSSMGEDNAYDQIAQIERSVRKQVEDGNREVFDLLLQFQSNPARLSSSQLQELVELGLVESTRKAELNLSASGVKIRDLYEHPENFKQRLNFYGEIWVLLHSYYEKTVANFVYTEIGDTLMPERSTKGGGSLF